MDNPKFKVGQKVLFQHPDDCNYEWLRGKISELIYLGEYFWGYAIAYRDYHKKTNCNCRLANEHWMKIDDNSSYH